MLKVVTILNDSYFLILKQNCLNKGCTYAKLHTICKNFKYFAGLTETFIGTKISINCVHFMCIDLVYCNVYYVLYTSTTSHNTVAF